MGHCVLAGGEGNTIKAGRQWRAGATNKKGGMALAAAWALWAGTVAADKMGHGVKICDSQAKP